MYPIFRRTGVAVALALTAVSGACSGESPTGFKPPSTPHMDGGVTLGSGSRTTSGSTDNTTTAADSGSTAARGGVTLGSGS